MKKCFVVSQIGDEGSAIRKRADNVLNGLIRPVCQAYDYEVIRIDELAGSKSIPDEIFNHLNCDDLAIVDITNLNPNVMLELGYRMRADKPFIIIRDSGDQNKAPFDIASIRYHEYGLLPDELTKSCATLSKAISACEDAKSSNITKLGQGLYLRKEADGSVSLCASKEK